MIGGHRVVVVQPTSTVLVYLLGLLTLAVGLGLLSRRDDQRSRHWWGVGLLLWGAGTLLAGTSYQAFSYTIKCAGRTICAWTSWWEVGYLLLTVWGIDALTRGIACACATGRGRRALSIYAAANAGLYTPVVLIGAFVPNRALVSFELLVFFAAPGVVTALGISAGRWRRTGNRLDRDLLAAWLGLISILGAYVLHLRSELTAKLWARGIWFSENDVLHLGLLLWMLFLAITVAPRLRDAPLSAYPSLPGDDDGS